MGTPSLKLQTMSTKGTVTIRPRKFITNRLLDRRQMVLDVHHPGLATPDKEMLKTMLSEFLSKAKGHKAQKEATVIFGVKTCFGGGKSSCFALVYDSVEALMKHEPKHRQIQNGHKGTCGCHRPQAEEGEEEQGEEVPWYTQGEARACGQELSFGTVILPCMQATI